jgi:hypothetical protein
MMTIFFHVLFYKPYYFKKLFLKKIFSEINEYFDDYKNFDLLKN